MSDQNGNGAPQQAVEPVVLTVFLPVGSFRNRLIDVRCKLTTMSGIELGFRPVHSVIGFPLGMAIQSFLNMCNTGQIKQHVLEGYRPVLDGEGKQVSIEPIFKLDDEGKPILEPVNTLFAFAEMPEQEQTPPASRIIAP